MADQSGMIGKRIQGYEILEARAAGAMGVVYKAKDPDLPRVVALKLVNRALADDTSFLDRFRMEAGALAIIQSPHIVVVHRLIDTENDLAIVMEYVEGKSLQELADSEDLSWQRAAKLVRQVLVGLGAAHAAGVIHRDIKPSNVLVMPGDIVKIVDFGLAKADQLGRNLTQTGTSAGTLFYMSPEQVQGFRSVGPRSDLYSVGMTLYRLVCGRFPFETTGSSYEVLKSIVEGVYEPADELNPLLPASLVRFLSKSLEKRADDRFADANEMIHGIDEVLGHHPPGSDAPGLRTLESGRSSDRGVGPAHRDRSTDPASKPDAGSGQLGDKTRVAVSDERAMGARSGSGLGPGAGSSGDAVRYASDHYSSPDPSLAATPSHRRNRPALYIAAVAAVALVTIAIAMLRSSFVGSPSVQNASLDVTTTPPGAEIYVDDTRIGPSPILDWTRSPGSVRIKAVLNGHQDRDSLVTLESGHEYHIAMALPAMAPTRSAPLPDTKQVVSPAETASTTALDVRIVPWGEVFLNGEHVGGEQVDTEIFAVAPGAVRVRVRHPEFGTWEKRVQATAGETSIVHVDFTRLLPVVVTSQTEDGHYVMGEIFVDGKSTGSSTPKEIKLRVGNHSIEVRQSGYTAEPVRVSLTGALKDPIKVVLRKQ